MGESSKKSGEIGEKLTSALLERIGWKPLMQNISIDCNTSAHINNEGNPRQTHGEDQIFLYHNPFHDDRTDFVHVSDKNNLEKYPREGTLKSLFKAYLKELHQTMDCAKFNPKLREVGSSYGAKKIRFHSGLLVWLHNDLEDIEKNIRPDLANVRPEIESDDPVYVVDNARASFLLKVVDDLKRRSSAGGEYNFFYPKIGTAVSVDSERKGKFLPLELIAAEMIPALLQKDGRQEMFLYSDEPFDAGAYKRLVAYGLNFNSGLVSNIHIGIPDFNPVRHKEEIDQVRMAFHERTEVVTPFSFTRSILDLLQE